uniref:C-type lectin domain-containing protein n=1 Tax=Periophthalmus magnuspinnatus TaxID=409849 RepID=A0A3B4AL22_9GOBI
MFTCLIVQKPPHKSTKTMDSHIPYFCGDQIPGEWHKLKSMTWFSARSYCRTNHDDLASIKTDEELPNRSAIMNGAGAYFAWIGLYRDPWTSWSDRTSTNFYNWETQPNIFHTYNCGCVTADTGKWHKMDCGTSKPFFLQQYKISYIYTTSLT